MQIEPGATLKPHRPHLQWLSLAVSVLLLLACGYFIYHRIDTRQILRILLSLDLKWLLAALGVFWLAYPMTAYRFRYVYRWCKPIDLTTKVPMSLILKITLSSGFVAVAAPVGLVADAARVGAFRIFAGISTTLAARSILFDRATSAQWIAFLSLAVIPLQWAMGVPNNLLGIQTAITLAVGAAVVILLVLPTMLGIFRHGLIVKIAHVFAGYKHMFEPRRMLVQLVFALIGALLSWATLFFILKSAALTADLWLLACFVPFLQLINSIPFLYMGWGGREIAMAATLGTVSGLTLNQALAVSAAWGAVQMVAGGVNGAFLLGDWRSHRNKHVRPPKIKSS